MGERGVRNAEVEGSNPLPSTMNLPRYLRVAIGSWWRMVASGGGGDVAIESRRRLVVDVLVHPAVVLVVPQQAVAEGRALELLPDAVDGRAAWAA